MAVCHPLTDLFPSFLLCKVLEKLVHNRLYFYLEHNDFLPMYQYGFRKGISTMDQLLHLEHHICLALIQRKVLIIVYVDFQGAFDRVPHIELLYKLAQLGIRGVMLGWLRDFLTRRSFHCFVQGDYSGHFACTSGVPQGSILSPTLFSVLVSDCPIPVPQTAYADDFSFFAVEDSF